MASDYSAVFQLVSDLIRKEKISCILIGGFAVNFHKVSRNTGDVDFLITKQDFDKVSDYISKAGFKKFSQHENFVQFESTGVGIVGVDFMFVDQSTFENIREEGQKFRMGKYEFIVPSLNHMIALKLHAMIFPRKSGHNEEMVLV